MKSYTDLEQSKRLAEILPIESADMYYKYVLPKSDRIIHTPEIGNPIDSLKWYNEGYTFRGKREPITLSEYCIPCWSLSALLNVIPYTIYKSDNEFYRLGIDKGYDDYAIWYNNNGFTITDLDVTSDNFVDACVAMIEKLHEQKLL